MLDVAKRPVDADMRYRGMRWVACAMPGGRSGFKAASDVTPVRYVIEPHSGGWRARYGFESPGRPNTEIGHFIDSGLAALAAERHDFLFWSSVNRRPGETPRFVGSDMVTQYAEALSEEDRERILPLLVGDRVLPDGSFMGARGSHFDAEKSQLRQGKGDRMLLTLSVSAKDLPMWLMEKPLGGRLAVGAADLSVDDEEDWIERGKRAVRQSFALESDSDFQRWMSLRYDRFSLIRSAVEVNSDAVRTAVGETLMRILGCPSHRQLSWDRDAIARFERLEAEFYQEMSRRVAL